MSSTDETERCVPCDDGRRLLIAAAVARLAWGLAMRRLTAEEADTLAPWAALAFSSVAPVFAYRLAVNLRLSRAAALAAGFLLAVHPALVDAGTLASPQAALPALAASGLVAWLYAWQSGRLGGAVLSGLCAGFAGWAGAPVAPAAAALVLTAFWRRREQANWRALAGAALLAAAFAAAPRARFAPPPPSAPTKWSASLIVAPAVGHQAPAVRSLFLVVLFAGALLGLRAVASGPGGWFVLAALLASFAGRLLGSGPPFSESALLAVLSGAGLSLFQGTTTTAR